MIRTPVCDLIGIEHPICLGGMASLFAVDLTVAVSEAGGLGTLGATVRPADEIAAAIETIRAGTEKPFGVNFLLFMIEEDRFEAALAARVPVLSFAWARRDQELGPYFDRAHQSGAKVMFMAGDVEEAVRGARAGADTIVAQGTEGGGHVGWTASMPLVPMIVDAVADAVGPVPVLAAGGIADGRGLAAALALGADGVLLGTRFLASDESPLHENFKQTIVASTGEDTELTETYDIAIDQDWPGAMARIYRNRFAERWAGRNWEVHARRAEIQAAIAAARKAGDSNEAPLQIGQDAGLVRDVAPAGELVARMAAEAEEILRGRLPGLVG
ncbi:MAG: nitronate monooxygenase [Alphaproteobacteria bacterium]|nr:nitronate monooxygenase [Alphaproteobacteria bacterium]